MKLSNIYKFDTLLNRSVVNKNALLISLQTVTFCAVFERERSNFHCIVEWETSVCNFDWSLSLSMVKPRYAFDLRAFCAETLQLLHQASPFSMGTDKLQFEHK